MWSRGMKRFVVTLALLLGSAAFATQHVVSKFFSFSWTDYQLILVREVIAMEVAEK